MRFRAFINRWVLPTGTCACGGLLAAADVLNFVTIGHEFADITWWIVHFYVLALGSLLCITSLFRCTSLYKHLGFLQYLGGTGALLILVGGLALGMGTFGMVAGVASFVVGGFSVLAHCCEKQGGSTPRAEPLLYPAV